MALSKADIKAAYPLPVYNYRVEIGPDAVAFSEVSGLSIGFETTSYKESPTESGAAGPREMTMPAQATGTTLSLKKGVTRGTSIQALYAWINTVQVNQVEKRDVTIRLCDEAGAPVISWIVRNAFPTRLDAPTFDANSNEVAVETLELTADGITIEEA